MSILKKLFFSLFQKPKDKHRYSKGHMSLVIMDTFKGQDNEVLKEFSAKSFCEVVTISHNLTNKFQVPVISVNKVAKLFV